MDVARRNRSEEKIVAMVEDFSKLKVAELKELLKERGLTVTGKKAELVARLQEAEAASKPTKKTTTKTRIGDGPASDQHAAQPDNGGGDGGDVCGGVDAQTVLRFPPPLPP